MADRCKDDIFFWTVRGRFIKSSNHVMNGLTHDDRPPVLDEPPKKRAKVTSGAQLSPSWEVDQVPCIKKIGWQWNSLMVQKSGEKTTCWMYLFETRP